jgi:tetratricopeptide (TPR) repeat protein
MSTAKLVAVGTFVWLVSPVILISAEPYKVGDKVMPRNRELPLYLGKEKVANNNKKKSEYEVRGINEDWLWVGEESKGWVQQKDVVSINLAAAHYEEMMRTEPGQSEPTYDFWPYFMCANTYGKQSMWKECVKVLDEVIANTDDRASNPARLEAYQGRLFAKYAIDDYQGCEADCTEALELQDDGWVRIFRAAARYYLEDYPGAIKDCDIVLRVDPQETGIFEWRGKALLKIGEPKRAIDDLSNAITSDPDNAELFSERGTAWGSLNDYHKAIEDFNRAIQISPEVGDYYESRGNAWVMLRNARKALDDYRDAIRLRGGSWARQRRAWILATHYDENFRDGAEAIDLAVKASEICGCDECLEALAAAYAESGQFELAVAKQREAIKKAKEGGDSDSFMMEKLAAYEDGKPWKSYWFHPLSAKLGEPEFLPAAEPLPDWFAEVEVSPENLQETDEVIVIK